MRRFNEETSALSQYACLLQFLVRMGVIEKRVAKRTFDQVYYERIVKMR